MKWLDSRIHKPNPNHYDQYQVIFLYCKQLMVGYCGYLPTDGYKDGKWENPRCFNGNQLEGEVIAWRENPKLPKMIRIIK